MASLVLAAAAASSAAEVVLRQTRPDPYGTPRPAPGAVDVPLATSFYFELALGADSEDDDLLAESVTLRIVPEGGDAIDILGAGRQFAPGYSGRIAVGERGQAGLVNLVVWPQVLERYEALARTQPFLGATGRIQAESGVVHLVAEALWRPRIESGPVSTGSRNFR